MAWLAAVPLWVGLAFLAFGLVLALPAIQYWRLARAVAANPVRAIADLAEGDVAFIGAAESPSGVALPANLSGKPCVWCRYSTSESHVSTMWSQDWRVLESGTSQADILIRDATGSVLVTPKDAEVMGYEEETWYGEPRHEDGVLINALRKVTELEPNVHRRFSESRLAPGSRLFVVGRLSAGRVSAPSGTPFVITTRTPDWMLSVHSRWARRFGLSALVPLVAGLLMLGARILR